MTAYEQLHRETALSELKRAQDILAKYLGPSHQIRVQLKYFMERYTLQ